MYNDEVFELTIPQKSIFITEQYFNNTNINNISGYLHIKENVDIKKLEHAINIFLKNHEQVRARIIKNDSQNIQQYYEAFKKEEIKVFYLRDIKEKANFEKEFCNKNFNIFNEKLYRFCIYKLDNGEGGIICSLHHLVCDAWSMTLLIDSLVNSYIGIDEEKNDDIQYKKFILEEENYYKSNKYKKDIEYWKNVFSTNIDSRNKNLQDEDIGANRLDTSIDIELVKKLLNIDKSFYNIYISALSIYFSKLNNMRNIIIGTPVLNRKNHAEKQMMGMFVNTLPLKFDVNRKISFSEFIRSNKINEIQMFKHQKMPYEKIMKLVKENDPQINNLFDITVSYQNARDNNKESILEYNSGWVFNGNISDSLDVHITDLDNTGEYNIIYDYQISKYKEKEIINIHNRIVNILKQVAEKPDILIKDIEIITDEEFDDINSINNITVDFPRNSTIISKFMEQVKRNPDNIAINFENEEITYKELDIRANKVANSLIAKKVQKNDIVALFLPKSLEYFISMIGVLKVGATYLPLDTEFPDTRINYILKDSKSKICITDEELVERITENVEILTNKKINNYTSIENIVEVNENDNCYIIYTSGTTRKSKRCCYYAW